MLSTRTKFKLATLLEALADGEKHLEVTRQVLAEIPKFEPYTTFRRLDSHVKGYLISADFYEFFSQNRLEIPRTSILSIFKNWDSNRDGKLSYTESIALEREAYFVKKDEQFPYEVDWALLRVLEHEINFNNQIENIINNLIESYDFSNFEAFRVLDPQNLGYLDISTVEDFLQEHNLNLAYYDIKCLLRRLDYDKDNKVTYSDFVEIMIPIHKLPIERKNYSSEKRRVSPQQNRYNIKQQQQLYYQQQQKYYSPINRNKPLVDRGIYTEPKRGRVSPIRNTIQPLARSLYQSRERKVRSPYNIKGKQEQFEFGTPQKNIKLQEDLDQEYYEYLRLSQQKSPMKGNEEEELVKALQELIQLDRECEIHKCELALQNDFNLFDAFKFFDFQQQGSISLTELEDGFNRLSIYPSQKEIYLLIRRFDKDLDGLLRYSDFCEIMSPKTAEYADILNNKTPLYVSSGEEQDQFVFSLETQKNFTQVLRLILNAEIESEFLRQKLSQRRLFSIYDAFKAIDKHQKGYVTSDEFRKLLEDYGIFTSSKDILHLMQRFDKDKDGRVTYAEFTQEMNPKTSKI